MLDMLWDIYKITGYNKDNTFILDDYDDVYKKQPDNAIIAIPFQYYDQGSEKDDFLKGLVELLKKLKEGKITIKQINAIISGEEYESGEKIQNKKSNSVIVEED
jgi:hypothetical protein